MIIPCQDCLCISVCRLKNVDKVIKECSLLKNYFVNDLGNNSKKRTINAYIDMRRKVIYTGYKKSIKKFTKMVEILYRGTNHEVFRVKFEGRFVSELPGTTTDQQAIVDFRF